MTPSSDSDERRVLVVAYYFPPMGLSGVQRTAKFVKYLSAHGWHPEVLTVQPGGYFAFDQDLMAEVQAAGIPIHRTHSWDPTRAFRRRQAVSLPSESTRSALALVSQWIFLPDNKIGWYPHALQEGKRLLKSDRFKAILSTAPPYSGHVIAARLARWSGLPLVLDYRDDWLDNPRHTYPTRYHRRLHAWLERRAAKASHAVIAINDPIARALSTRLGRSVEVIPQGFDPADYPEQPPRESKSLTFVYSGVFYDRQSPVPFLEGLALLLTERPQLRERVRASFVGLFPEEGIEAIKRLGLSPMVSLHPYTSHREAMRHVVEADVPWLVVGEGPGQDQISTGKLYAYAGAGKPILGIVPDGAAAEALAAYGASWVAHPDRPAEIAGALGAIVDAWQEGRMPQASEVFTAAHDRDFLAGQLAGVLERVTS